MSAKQFPALVGAGCLLVWAISVAGVTGWGRGTNLTLFGVGLALLALRTVA
jgi:hypothetical protein